MGTVKKKQIIIDYKVAEVEFKCEKGVVLVNLHKLLSAFNLDLAKMLCDTDGTLNIHYMKGCSDFQIIIKYNKSELETWVYDKLAVALVKSLDMVACSQLIDYLCEFISDESAKAILKAENDREMAEGLAKRNVEIIKD